MAGAKQCTPVGIPSEAPGVARFLAEYLELAGKVMAPPHRAGEVERPAFRDDVAVIEDTVEPIQPAVGAPCQRIGQLMRVRPAEPGDDHFAANLPAVLLFHK